MGVSPEEVEEEIKIRTKYIEALEEDDYDVLPGKVYVKGFVKLYGEYLNLDVPDLLDRLEEFYAGPAKEEPLVEEEKAIDKAADKPKFELPEFKLEKNHLIIGGIALALIALLIVVPAIAKFFKSDNKADTKEQIPVEENTDQPVANKNKSQENPLLTDEEQEEKDKEDERKQEEKDKENEDLTLRIKIIDVSSEKDECWVQMYSDGAKEYEGILEEGQTKTIKADEKIKISVGNAGVAEVYLGKKKIGLLGELGQPVMNVEYTKDDL